MLNEFLTQTLQVIVALDVAGVVAYFLLSALRARRRQAVVATARAASSSDCPSLWQKLARRRRLSRPLAVALADDSLSGALSRLRRVLDSYGSSLA